MRDPFEQTGTEHNTNVNTVMVGMLLIVYSLVFAIPNCH